ncbi:uncharacterized protein K489DRAFT_413904 [Dissoconium aciculare CBS 342.82]|uniref:F-box domain-containing protein n=1 Tax=Dissoconium aciculare CBS 342.82 TaxID=1314786 RepID=A0A6J3LR11_9PEZI|nr:uncharacterized protein K489DRAFT_413904 [Dissoconium aciculare CBS 342.82]KAF1818275.1 hypothetical protein K489DRAFT_413904 [Dissoconium aciculare CBS 342.82]
MANDIRDVFHAVLFPEGSSADYVHQPSVDGKPLPYLPSEIMQLILEKCDTSARNSLRQVNEECFDFATSALFEHFQNPPNFLWHEQLEGRISTLRHIKRFT